MVGRVVTRLLASAGREVRVLDPVEPVPSSEDAQRAIWTKGTISDVEALDEVLDGCDSVVHLAAKVPQSMLDEEGFYSANVVPTRALATRAVEHGVRRLVFASTIEIYGPQPSEVPLSEDAERRFTGHYSRNKWECEELLRSMLARGELESVFLRMPLILGPGISHEPQVLRVFRAMRRGLPLPVLAPDARVSFVDVEDVAAAFVLALGREEVVGEAFNIAAGDTPHMDEFFEGLVSAVGSRSRTIRIRRGLARAGMAAGKTLARLNRGSFAGTPIELMEFALTGGAYAIDKARRMLSYEPEISTVEAWARAYRWWDSARR